MERNIDMGQTIEEAAKEFALSDITIGLPVRSASFKAFKAGAEWQAKQSPWRRVKDQLPPVDLLLLHLLISVLETVDLSLYLLSFYFYLLYFL